MRCNPSSSLTPRQIGKQLAITYFQVIMISVVIAAITQKIWGNSFYTNYIIALVFGLTGSSTHTLLSWRFPKLNAHWLLLISVWVTLTIGTLNAGWWLSSVNMPVDYDLLAEIAFISLFFCLIVFYFFISRDNAITMQAKLHKAEMQQAQLQHAAITTQLQQLQSQIEPHFLFNTLANLKALILHDPKLAELLLDKFTELLRLNLSKNRADKISLADELTGLKTYLEIQKIRLGQRLHFTIQYDKHINLQLPLPPQLLQPLVENAVFHGIEPSINGGNIWVEAKQSDNKLYFSVIDDGAGLNEQSNSKPGHGFALSNIRQRLQLHYGEQARLSIHANNHNGVSALMEIPCEH